MTAEEFKAVQILLSYSNVDLARVLRTPLRTVEDWRAGRHRIPGLAEVALLLLARVRGHTAADLAAAGVKNIKIEEEE